MPDLLPAAKQSCGSGFCFKFENTQRAASKRLLKKVG
jgi:hypothetical protein